ncbi:MAG: hypothetical protein HC829_07055 [Bacteroidales bacterium]|nr:hypothetical protein [Bacteroidales bacterium]
MVMVRGLLGVVLRSLFRLEVRGSGNLAAQPGRRRLAVVCQASHLDPLIGLVLRRVRRPSAIERSA